MRTNIGKFEPNLPMFRNFSVSWGLGGEVFRKKIQKIKTGSTKSQQKNWSLGGGVIFPNLGGRFQMRPYFNSVAVENVQIYRKGTDNHPNFVHQIQLTI